MVEEQPQSVEQHVTKGKQIVETSYQYVGAKKSPMWRGINFIQENWPVEMIVDIGSSFHRTYLHAEVVFISINI
jgi:hypothetical protein